MSNKVKLKKTRYNKEQEKKANTKPWLIALIIFAIVVVGVAIGTSFIWGTSKLPGRSDAAAAATTISSETAVSTESAAATETAAQN